MPTATTTTRTIARPVVRASTRVGQSHHWRQSQHAPTTGATGAHDQQGQLQRHSRKQQPTKSGVLDYSRWDHIDVSDDDDDNDRESNGSDNGDEPMEVDSLASQTRLASDEADENDRDELDPDELARARELLKATRQGGEAEHPLPGGNGSGSESGDSAKVDLAAAAADSFAALRQADSQQGCTRRLCLATDRSGGRAVVLLPPGTRGKELRPGLVAADLAGNTAGPRGAQTRHAVIPSYFAKLLHTRSPSQRPTSWRGR